MASYQPSKSGTDLCLHIVYSICLLLTAILGTVAIASPYWLITPRPTPTSPEGAIGIVTSCSDESDRDSCERYGDEPKDIPVEYWRGTAGVTIFALMIIWLCFLFSLFTCCMCQSLTRPQIPLLFLSSILIIIGLFLFGAGMEEDYAQQQCNSDRFDRGDCDLGSGGGLAVATFVFVIISAVISIFVKPAEDSIA